ncbi:MAG TPA: hypothetical protein VK604_11130 [Bryobacteraceae bacterium]|nr:hypothetical protein [Bryobacteraceae bacterium]
MKKLFTERNEGSKPRISEILDDITRAGLLELVNRRMDDEWFGEKFPANCSYGYKYAGTNLEKLKTHMAVHGVLWPLDTIESFDLPSDGQMFCWNILTKL